jgi:hypothetical protein
VARNDDLWTLRLDHRDGTAAIGIVVEDDRSIGEAGWAEAEDGGLDMLPGERADFHVTWRDVPAGHRRLRVSAWNVDPMVLE